MSAIDDLIKEQRAHNAKILRVLPEAIEILDEKMGWIAYTEKEYRKLEKTKRRLDNLLTEARRKTR